MSDDEHIPVEEAAARLGISTRQAHRYAELGRIRIRRLGRRNAFHAGDVDRLAVELGRVRDVTPARPPKQEMLPAGELLEYLRQRDQTVEELTRQLTQAAARVGYLEGELSRRMLPDDAVRLAVERDQARADVARLQGQLDQVRRDARRRLVATLVLATLVLALMAGLVWWYVSA